MDGNFLILFICATMDFRDISFTCFSGKKGIQWNQQKTGLFSFLFFALILSPEPGRSGF